MRIANNTEEQYHWNSFKLEHYKDCYNEFVFSSLQNTLISVVRMSKFKLFLILLLQIQIAILYGTQLWLITNILQV